MVAKLEQALANALKAPALQTLVERTQTEVDFLNSADFKKVLVEENTFLKGLLGEVGLLKP